MIRLSVRCRPEQAEEVLAELLELAPGGVEEDASNPGGEAGETAGPGSGWVEYAIYGAPGELPLLPDLHAIARGAPVEIETAEIPDDWADRWRDFHEPVLVGERLMIRPSWHDEALPAAIEVVIDPGQAFGTGAHATTRLALELLLELADAGHAHGSLADLGTGSAVLAIAAAKLGWAPVTGVDHEPAAIEAAGANATLNAVEIGFERVNLRSEPPPSARTLLANLTAPLLRSLATALANGPERLPERVICSGMLAREVDAVSQAFGAAGLAEVERRERGEWAALLAERRPAGGLGWRP